ncbi:MAG: metallophosphoesterase family protein [Enhydrobacter sp.]
MKLGIISDIHCNVLGLQAALAAIGPVDDLLCLGDSISQNRFSNEVVGLLRSSGARIILGNHEELFLSEAGKQARAQDQVDQELVAFLADQPLQRRLTYDGKTVLMSHSTPWEPRGEYIYPHNERLEQFAEAGADFILYGHTHAEVVRRVGDVIIVNPGSAGETRYTPNGWRLSCAVLDTVTCEVRMISYVDPRDAG